MIMKTKFFENDTRIYLNNVFNIGFFRVLTIITNFLLVGLIFRYLNSEELNGVWLTVFSIVTWLAVFDFGIGNGLRNKLTEAVTLRNIPLANSLIVTSYIILSIPTILINVAVVIFAHEINWVRLLNLNNHSLSNEYLTVFMIILTIFYSFNFYLSLIHPVFHSVSKSYVINFVQFITNLINVVVILLLLLFKVQPSLITLCLLYLGSSILVLSIVSINFFRFSNSTYRFKIKYYNRGLVREILKIGGNFFILQLAIIVLFNTDNFLISFYLGVKDVSSYQLVNKLLSIYTTLMSILLIPIWTVIIKYNINKEYTKLRKVIKLLMFAFIIISVFVWITAINSKFLIAIWVGEELDKIDFNLIMFMAIFTVVHIWCNIFQYILNGLNYLRIQMYCYGVAMIINIPISIILVLNTDLKVSGIILGTIISLSIPSVILPFYLSRKLRKY
ncbi:MAG: polysaccharide biosynthesis C-terminal domain-containing protein [Firmicutes bacterium]|nr:polysaccharide biosynthesis C-terminal domain-containing protein [Bacillota bacterium]